MTHQPSVPPGPEGPFEGSPEYPAEANGWARTADPAIGGLTQDALGGFSAKSDLAACLVPLLQALGWHGNPRHVAEALPHFANDLDITDLRNVMANLNYASRPATVRLSQVDHRLLPCLFVPARGPALVVTGRQGRQVTAFNGETRTAGPVTRLNRWGTAYFFSALDGDDKQAQQQRVGWFNLMVQRFRTLVWRLVGVTLILNVLGLATPLFVMGVYDKVVGPRAVDTLGWFAAGVTLAVAFDAVLRSIRARMLAYIGARLDSIVGNAVFQSILYLAPSFTERATIGAQVARIKDFESVREFFTGPMAMVFLEVPFIAFYILALAFLAGPVAFVPMTAVAMFAVLGWVLAAVVRGNVAESAKAGSRRQEFLVETMAKMRALKQTGAEQVWLNRFRGVSARAAMASFRTAQTQNLLQTISHMMVVASGVGAMALGVTRVMDGEMSAGALIASMILVWRTLSPLQSVYLSLSRFEQIRASIKQINNLMNIQLERDPQAMVQPLKRYTGKVSFARVSLRYIPGADPALVGVSFVAEPGEVVVVVGPNGSGKSTILKLIAGLYQLQAGSVRIDGSDIRQVDPIELRHAVAYVPQVCTFFYGTIAQNLRLAEPTASDEDLRWALDEAGALDEVEALSEGLGTRIGDGRSEQLSASLRQRLNLARAYLKRAPIYLFDEPVNGLDFGSDQKFMETVRRMRGHATVFIVTHRPSHFNLADKIILMEGGYMRLFGPAAEVRPKIPMELI